MSRHSPECSGSIAMICGRFWGRLGEASGVGRMQGSFRRSKRCRQNAGVVRGLHFQIPAQAKIGAWVDPRRRSGYA